MNARLRMLLVGSVCVAGSIVVWAQAAQTSGRDADAAAIRAHIESIFAAFVDKDAAKLAATHGRDWRGYLTFSRTVVKGRDGYMNANVGITAGRLRRLRPHDDRPRDTHRANEEHPQPGVHRPPPVEQPSHIEHQYRTSPAYTGGASRASEPPRDILI